MRAPLRVLAGTTLVLEAFVAFFAGLVAKDLSGVSTGTALAVFWSLSVAFVLAAGALRSRAGYILGTVLQVSLVATGLLVPVMFFLGVLFALLWAVSLHQGARIERERAEYARREGEGSAPA
jgi:hypothetical protein